MAKKLNPLGDDELLAAIDAEEQTALGSEADSIASDRADAIDRYLGKDYTGDLAAPPGRSSVVSRDVADVVEGVIANTIKPFVGGDRVVQFNPMGPDDEGAAEQETDYCNFIALQRNNGFLVLNAAMKDALLLRNGYVICDWTVRQDAMIETYKGLADDELAAITADKDVEVVAHSEYPDPYWMPPPMPPMGMMPPGAPMPPPEAMQPPMLHDIKLKRVRPTEFVSIMPAPPDEILVSKRSRGPSLQDCDFVQHRTHLTLSEVRQMGYQVDDDVSDAGNWDDQTIEDQSRQRFGARGLLWNDDTSDPARRMVLFKRTWLRIDRDGDGIAELRRVCSIGRNLLSDEEYDIIPIACGTAILMQHQHLGLSVYDMVQDLARLKTALLRQFMDNKYLANNPQTYVDAAATGEYMDDYLISRPGGIRRTNGSPQNSVMVAEYPDTGASALQGLEYLDSIRENRTGYTRQSQGLETDALVSKTVGGMAMQLSQAQLRLEMMARTIAETMVRDMFLIIHALTLKHSSKAEKVRINKKWVLVNPREWVRRTEMSISVGIGSASQQTMMAGLTMIGQAQQQAMPLQLVTPTNVYNLLEKITNAVGFKNVDDFFTPPPIDPQTGKPVPPPQVPSPQEKVEMIRQQGDQAKFGAQQQADAAKFQMEMQAKDREQQNALALQASNDQRDAARTQMEFQLKEREMMLQLELQRQQHQMDKDTEIQIANIRAAAQVETARISAAQSDGAALVAQEEKKAGYDMMNQVVKAIQSALSAPKQVVRGPDGRVSHVVPVQSGSSSIQ